MVDHGMKMNMMNSTAATISVANIAHFEIRIPSPYFHMKLAKSPVTAITTPATITMTPRPGRYN